MTMKLIDYLNEGKNNTSLPVDSIRYYYDTDSDGYESEDIGITDTHLIFEDIMFDLNTDGMTIDGVFRFVDSNGVAVGIETWF